MTTTTTTCTATPKQARRVIQRDFLRSARQMLGDYTQGQLAADLDINRCTITRYETGDLRLPKIVKLAVYALLVAVGCGDTSGRGMD